MILLSNGTWPSLNISYIEADVSCQTLWVDLTFAKLIKGESGRIVQFWVCELSCCVLHIA